MAKEEEIIDKDVVKVNLQELADSRNEDEDKIHKVDLSKKSEEEEEEETTVEKGEEEEDDDSVLSEVTEEEEEEEEDEEEEEEDEEEDEEEEEDKVTYPENVQKLVDFMNDTGGTIEDYVLLNKDVSGLSEDQLLLEYHKNVEPGLENDEYKFIMEDLYSYDEDLDEERTITKRKLAKKRALVEAKSHLEGLKTKYYDEIKAGSKLTKDQQKAVNFFNRYNEDQEVAEKSRIKQQEVFTEKTKGLFSDKFKGFEFKVGDKTYRYNVKDAASVMKNQSSIKNFTKKYLGDDEALKDAKGYHKAIFAAMNADEIANHFYKQGMADAVKSSAKNQKNINMDPRKGHGSKFPNAAGVKARVVSDDTPSGKLRIKQ